ncbi:unnamed protein product, partial [Sphacelaria rigidula]
MVIFLGALVPAVANRNFQYHYDWVVEQRKLALTRAYMLLKGPDGTVGRDDWVSLMGFLRPECDSEHTSALFFAAKKAEANSCDLSGSGSGMNTDGNGATGDQISKGGFFMLCALGKANLSKVKH